MESILNVDDYGPGRYARTRILQQAGFTVLEASTGAEAIETARAHSPDLILLDVNLPDIHGFEVCRIIRQSPRPVNSTIVHISASNIQPHHQVSGLEGGADSYLVEPIEPTVLIATVKALLRAREAEEALRHSNKELEQFSYRVAHDLTEPLRTIIAHTQLMDAARRTQPPPDTTESMRFVVEAARRMQVFIDGLLAYSRVSHETGGERRDVDCEQLLAIALADLAMAIQESGATLTNSNLPRIHVSPGFEQVFLNLISNAIKYHRPGVAPKIHVEARASGDEWIFSVRDNGIGIDARYRDYVFQPFQRLHGREIPGSGIGLATVRKIVEANDGSIWVESVPGEGSTFFFRLPQASHTSRAKTAQES
ncbi:MAG TPA: ATP-binding protein [Bryobacteraceae bacterium]|nr:ATP-binding protein [Bryobacteraceae bacterium]